MRKSLEHEMLKKAGDLSSLYGIRDSVINDGRARGVRVFDLKNGCGLNATIFADRGLDIPYLSYKGYNIAFLSKSGISSPFSYSYSKDGLDSFLRQFSGGFLTTCGITYSGAPCIEEGKELALHGMVSNTIAENVAAQQTYQDDEAILKVTGSIREARIFAENMRLNREIIMKTESNEIYINDVVENLGYSEQPLMVLYHVNFGYPILDSGSRVYFSTKNVEPQTDFAKQGLNMYNVIEEPENIREEQCYYHTIQDDPSNSFAMLYNPKLKIAAVVHYDAIQCPILCEWKSMQSGDYALGLEPTTCGTHGRLGAKNEGVIKYLAPGKSYSYNLRFEFLDELEQINLYRDHCKED